MAISGPEQKETNGNIVTTIVTEQLFGIGGLVPFHYGKEAIIDSGLVLKNRQLLFDLQTVAREAGLIEMANRISRQFSAVLTGDPVAILSQMRESRSFAGEYLHKYGIETVPLDYSHSKIDYWINIFRQMGTYCSVSNTHLSQWHEIAAMQELGVDISNIGLIVIDQHFDIGDGINFNKTDPVHDPEPYKSSFLRNFLQKGLGGLCIIGLSQDISDKYLGNFDFALEGSERLEPSESNLLEDEARNYRELIDNVMTPYGDKIVVVEEKTYIERQLRYKKLQEQVRIALNQFAQLGVKNIVFSIDMDGFDLVTTPITITPYSPWAALYALGIVDLERSIKREELRRMRQTLTNIENERKRLKKYRKGANEKNTQLLDEFDSEGKQISLEIKVMLLRLFSDIELLLQSEATKSNTRSDLLYEEYLDAIQSPISVYNGESLIKYIRSIATRLGLDIGIKTSSGTLYLGGVYEAEYNDYNGNGARAVHDLVSAISGH